MGCHAHYGYHGYEAEGAGDEEGFGQGRGAGVGERHYCGIFGLDLVVRMGGVLSGSFVFVVAFDVLVPGQQAIEFCQKKQDLLRSFVWESEEQKRCLFANNRRGKQKRC